MPKAKNPCFFINTNMSKRENPGLSSRLDSGGLKPPQACISERSPLPFSCKLICPLPCKAHLEIALVWWFWFFFLPKQRKWIFSQFQRLESQDPGASRIGFSWDLSHWLADGHLLAVSLKDFSSVLALVVSIFFFLPSGAEGWLTFLGFWRESLPVQWSLLVFFFSFSPLPFPSLPEEAPLLCWISSWVYLYLC